MSEDGRDTGELRGLREQGTARHYSDHRLRHKLRRWGRVLGRRAVYESLLLWHALKDAETPRWAKLTIAGALGYLILPLDALPDPLFVDDAVVVAQALVAVRLHVKPEHEDKAREKADELVS